MNIANIIDKHEPEGFKATEVGLLPVYTRATVEKMLGEASSVPEGWKLVPAEPTDDMVVAFSEEWYSHKQAIDDPKMKEAYAAMLAAAPSPAKEQSQ